MPTELMWLTYTLLMTALFWLPYVLNRMAVRGLMGSMANPSPDLPPQPAWAERARAAHTNAAQNLVIFAPLVLVATALGITGGLVASAAILYFWSRLIHYVVYTLGWPVIRTLAFFGGFVAQIMVVWAILSGM